MNRAFSRRNLTLSVTLVAFDHPVDGVRARVQPHADSFGYDGLVTVAWPSSRWNQ